MNMAATFDFTSKNAPQNQVQSRRGQGGDQNEQTDRSRKLLLISARPMGSAPILDLGICVMILQELDYLTPTKYQCKNSYIHSFHQLVLDFCRFVLPLLHDVFTLLLRRLDALICLCPKLERFFSAAVAVRKQSASVHLGMFYSILRPVVLPCGSAPTVAQRVSLLP